VTKVTIVNEEGSAEGEFKENTALKKMKLSRYIMYYIDGEAVAPRNLTKYDILNKSIIGVGKPIRSGGAPLSWLLSHYWEELL